MISFTHAPPRGWRLPPAHPPASVVPKKARTLINGYAAAEEDSDLLNAMAAKELLGTKEGRALTTRLQSKYPARHGIESSHNYSTDLDVELKRLRLAELE